MPTFNEPERWLLEKWTDACFLEKSMQDVRKKYQTIVDDIAATVEKRQTALDCHKARIAGSYGAIVFGKESWPKSAFGWPSGFIIENLQLENLKKLDSDPPSKSIWIFDPDLADVEARLRKAAENFLGKGEAGGWEFAHDRNGMGIWRRLEPREELLDKLLKDDSRGFIDCMVAHFDQMAKFTDLLNEIVATGNRRRN